MPNGGEQYGRDVMHYEPPKGPTKIVQEGPRTGTLIGNDPMHVQSSEHEHWDGRTAHGNCGSQGRY